MNSKEIKHYIDMEIENLGKLRDELDNEGEPLSPARKTTIRRVIAASLLTDIIHDMKSNFEQGERQRYVNCIEHSINVLDSLL